MLTTLPTTTPSRASYLQELEATLAQTSRIHGLPQLPWTLLALNATFYLDRYLTRSAYQTALATALQMAAAERQDWYALPNTIPTDRNELQRLVAAGTSRATLYRWIFDRAAQSGNPAQFLLAQHACEIAEVVAAPQLLPALRLGLITVPASALAPVVAWSPSITSGTASIEHLSRALLRHRIPARHFAASLLLLHAAQRAQKLTGHTYSVPLEDPQPGGAHSPACVPKRLRIVQAPELVQRAIAAADPLAIMLIEAGLVEAEALRGAPYLLLLSALDRALTDLS
jgi:hypothetical protein